MPVDLLHFMEKTVENNAHLINVDQAVNLVQSFSQHGSSYTLEVFDRIIGPNVHNLTPD